MSVADTQGIEELRGLIESYNGLAERLTASQKALQSEVLELRRELAEKNRQLARKNRLEILGEMAAGVAHEIRNPLGGIELCAGLIARERACDAKVTRWARRIQDATADLSAIVGEILDFTRPVKPRIKPGKLASAADAALDLAASAIEGRGIIVQRKYDPAEPLVSADMNLLGRAFLNIVLNAVEAAGEGGLLSVATGPAEIDSRPAGMVSFADSGPGIEPDAMEKVFNPFFTTTEHGTGLGLAMVARIVEAHRAHITVGNREAGGAVFTVTVPAVDVDRGDRRGGK